MTIDKRTIDDVNKVFNYYKVEKDEARFEIGRIKNNLHEASKCYSIIAAGIRGMEDANTK